MLSKFELEAIGKLLDQLDHYKILKIPSHASEEEIRAAFHREALNLHPDQYAHLKDEEVLTLTKNIYSRVIEAYRTLVSTERRTEYDRLLKKTSGNAAPHQQQQEEEITAVRRKEKSSTTTAGLKFFKLAQAAFQSRDLHAAKMNIQIALNTDSHNPEYLDLAHRIDSEIAKRKK